MYLVDYNQQSDNFHEPATHRDSSTGAGLCISPSPHAMACAKAFREGTDQVCDRLLALTQVIILLTSYVICTVLE